MRTRSTTMGELVDAGVLLMSDGYRTRRSELGEPGYRIIRVADVSDGKVSLRSPDFVHEDRAKQIGVKAGEPGDVLLTTKGTVGRVAVLPSVDGPVVYSPQLCFFRVLDESIVDPHYLRYWFASPAFLRQASDRMNNTDMAAYINLADIRSLGLDLPGVADQRAIADVLGALDDKIAANARTITTLSELVDAQFAHLVGRPSATARWGHFVQVVRGVSYRSVDLSPSDTALVTLKSFRRTGGYTPLGLKPYVGGYRPTQRVGPGEVVVAQTDLTQGAEVVGRAVRVPSSPQYRSLVASLDVAIVRPTAGIPVEFVLGVMLDERFREHCRQHTRGTTVLHLEAGAIESYQAPDAPAWARERFAATVRPMLALMDSLALEHGRLAGTRDALLPVLMSGRLRVRDAVDRTGGAGR